MSVTSILVYVRDPADRPGELPRVALIADDTRRQVYRFVRIPASAQKLTHFAERGRLEPFALPIALAPGAAADTGLLMERALVDQPGWPAKPVDHPTLEAALQYVDTLMRDESDEVPITAAGQSAASPQVILPGGREFLQMSLASHLAASLMESLTGSVTVGDVYVQWAPGGPGLQVEVISDQYLPESQKIGRFGARRMRSLGFKAPTSDDPNWTMWLEHTAESMRPAEAVITALLDVFLVPMPELVVAVGPPAEGPAPQRGPRRHGGRAHAPAIQLIEGEEPEDVEPEAGLAEGVAYLDLWTSMELIQALTGIAMRAVHDSQPDLGLRASAAARALARAALEGHPSTRRRWEPATPAPRGSTIVSTAAADYFALIRVLGEAHEDRLPPVSSGVTEDPVLAHLGDEVAWAGGDLTPPPPVLLPEPDPRRADHRFGLPPTVELKEPNQLRILIRSPGVDRAMAKVWREFASQSSWRAQFGAVRKGHAPGHAYRWLNLTLRPSEGTSASLSVPLCVGCHKDVLSRASELDSVRIQLATRVDQPFAADAPVLHADFAREGEDPSQVPVPTQSHTLENALRLANDGVMDPIKNLPPVDDDPDAHDDDPLHKVDPLEPHVFVPMPFYYPFDCMYCYAPEAASIHMCDFRQQLINNFGEGSRELAEYDEQLAQTDAIDEAAERAQRVRHGTRAAWNDGRSDALIYVSSGAKPDVPLARVVIHHDIHDRRALEVQVFPQSREFLQWVDPSGAEAAWQDVDAFEAWRTAFNDEVAERLLRGGPLQGPVPPAIRLRNALAPGGPQKKITVETSEVHFDTYVPVAFETIYPGIELRRDPYNDASCGDGGPIPWWDEPSDAVYLVSDRATGGAFLKDAATIAVRFPPRAQSLPWVLTFPSDSDAGLMFLRHAAHLHSASDPKPPTLTEERVPLMTERANHLLAAKLKRWRLDARRQDASRLEATSGLVHAIAMPTIHLVSEVVPHEPWDRFVENRWPRR